MVAEVDMRTIDAFTVKVTLLLPAGTVTLEGTLAAALLLESVTCAPPAGAGPLSVTVPVEDCTPPTTLVGFNVSEELVAYTTLITSRVAVLVVLLYEAEMVAEVDVRTIDAFTVKVTLLLPAGTVTLEGTLAAALLLESATCAPPAGAGPLSVTVPVEDCTPPTTLVGFNVSEETVGRGGGITVSEADVLGPP